MARVNKKDGTSTTKVNKTHGGAKAMRSTAITELRRAMLATMLFENAHYESGESIAARIKELAPKVSAEELNAIIKEAKFDGKLRHAPLWLALGNFAAVDKDVLTSIFTRPDDITDFVSLYWRDGKKPLKRKMKTAINAALNSYDAYQLGKYKGSKSDAVRLVDIMNLTHPKAKDEAQNVLFRSLINGELATPDTWETALSAAGKQQDKSEGAVEATKKSEWERLLKEGKLGYLALLRNLRNMDSVGVDRKLIAAALLSNKGGREKIFPFQFLAAAREVPKFEAEINDGFLASMAQRPKLKGHTLVVLDTSGSMMSAMGDRSTMTRFDAACGLGIITRELCETATVYATAGNDGLRKHATALVPSRRGIALYDAIKGMEKELGHGGIFLTQVCDYIRKTNKDTFDRMIVITDEQDCDTSNSPQNAVPLGKYNYMINVNSYKPSITFNKWIAMTTLSDKLLDFIAEYERLDTQD